MEVATEGKELCVHLHIEHRQGHLHDGRGRGGGRGQRLWGEVTERREEEEGGQQYQGSLQVWTECRGVRGGGTWQVWGQEGEKKGRELW